MVVLVLVVVVVVVVLRKDFLQLLMGGIPLDTALVVGPPS